VDLYFRQSSASFVNLNTTGIEGEKRRPQTEDCRSRFRSLSITHPGREQTRTHHVIIYAINSFMVPRKLWKAFLNGGGGMGDGGGEERRRRLRE